MSGVCVHSVAEPIHPINQSQNEASSIFNIDWGAASESCSEPMASSTSDIRQDIQTRLL